MGDDDLIRRGDAARAVALCSAESDSPNAHFVCRQAVNAIRAIPAADAREAIGILQARVEDQATEIAQLTRIIQRQPPRIPAADARADALKEAEKALRNWQDSLNAHRMMETAVTVGMAADVVAALIQETKP